MTYKSSFKNLFVPDINKSFINGVLETSDLKEIEILNNLVETGCITCDIIERGKRGRPSNKIEKVEGQ